MTKSEWVDNYSTENSFILPACEIWYLCVQKIFWANKTWTHVGTFGFCLWARWLYVSFSPPLRFTVECAFQSHTPFHAMYAWFRNRNFIVANEAFIWSRKKYFLMKKFQKKRWLFEYFFGQMYCCPNDAKSKTHGKTFEHIFSSSTYRASAVTIVQKKSSQGGGIPVSVSGFSAACVKVWAGKEKSSGKK